jgi:hypothetical protein
MTILKQRNTNDVRRELMKDPVEFVICYETPKQATLYMHDDTGCMHDVYRQIPLETAKHYVSKICRQQNTRLEWESSYNHGVNVLRSQPINVSAQLRRRLLAQYLVWGSFILTVLLIGWMLSR